MSRLTTVLATHRRARARRRSELALRQAIAHAPTLESAHELTALSARL